MYTAFKSNKDDSWLQDSALKSKQSEERKEAVRTQDLCKRVVEIADEKHKYD